MGSPTVASARNAVRHLIRDGMPSGDATPVAFETVRLEDLSDQIPLAAIPPQTVFQVRFDRVPTQRYITVQAVPSTLVAYVDGSWAPAPPTVDVDGNGNFTLPAAPTSQLLVSYAWQYFSDGAVDLHVDQARGWLREFTSITLIPDGLAHVLTRYAAAQALRALARQATLALVRAGDSEVDFSALAKAYITEANALEKTARTEREQFYSRGPEVLDPTAVDVSSLAIDPYEPRR